MKNAKEITKLAKLILNRSQILFSNDPRSKNETFFSFFFGCKKSLLIKLQSFDREIEFEFNLNKFTIENKFY